MSKKVRKLVPELRFSEFKGDWEIKSVEKIASVSSGGTPSRTKPTYWNGDIPWITTSETSQSEILDSVEKITKKGLENSSAKLFPKDTILMAMYGQGKTRGQVSLLRINAATSQNFAAITLKKDYVPEFVYLFLSQEYERLRALSNGNAHKSLSSGLVKKYKIPVTETKEQEKIASFLNVIALRITQLRRKHELLETYKKGVMQKIFSQQIRFKQDDGSNFPNWKEKKLKNICSLIKDGTHGTHKDDSNGQFFLLSAKNVFNGKVLYDNNDRKISQDEFSSIYKNYTLEKNDILLSIVGSIGRVAIFDGTSNLAFQRSVAFFRLKKDIPSFIYHQMIGFLFQRELLRRQVVSAQPGIYLGDLGKILVFIPCIKEQEKIANFLTSIDKKIDKKIEAVSLQIEKTELFKKGLLQKMFV